MSDTVQIQPGDTYQTDGISFGRFSFKKRELLIAVGLVVLIVMSFVFVGLFVNANNAGSGAKSTGGVTSAQRMGTTASTGNGTTKGTTKSTGTTTPFTTPTPDPRTCNSVPCLRGSAYVLRLINTSVDPCEDFYAYACGNWPTKHPLKPNQGRSSPFQNLNDINVQKVRTMLGSDVLRNTPWSAERKAKHLYSSCMDSYGRMVAGGNPVVDKVLSKIGGWWLVHDLPPDWNILSAIEKVHVDFWTDVLFNVYVGRDYSYYGYRYSSPIITITFGGLGMGKGRWGSRYYLYNFFNKTRTDYKTYMRKVATLLARDGKATSGPALDTKIDTFVSDVMLLETNLANVTRYSSSNQINLTQLNSQTHNMVDWVSFMKYMFSDDSITSDTIVKLENKDYIVDVADMIRQLPSDNRTRMLNNYFVWQIAAKYASDLSYEYINAVDRFNRDRRGSKEPLDPSAYCFDQVKDSMGVAISHIFISDHFSDQSQQKVMDIANYIKASLIERVDNMTVMDAATKTFAKKKLNVSSSNYFDNVLSLNGFLKKDAHNRLLELHGEAHPEWQGNTFDAEVKFLRSNELTAQAGILQDPFFGKDKPHYLNFGSIGTMFASNYTSAIDRYGMRYDENGEYYRGPGYGWWSSSTLANYNKAKLCFKDFFFNKTGSSYLDAAGNVVTVRVSSNAAYRNIRKAFAEVSGAKTAYQAYHDWQKKYGEEKLPPGMDQSNDQMFFLAYAQTKCSVTRLPRITYMYRPGYIGWNVPIPDSLQLNGAVSMLPEFSAAFGCSADSTLNPKKKCSLF